MRSIHSWASPSASSYLQRLHKGLGCCWGVKGGGPSAPLQTRAASPQGSVLSITVSSLLVQPPLCQR